MILAGYHPDDHRTREQRVDDAEAAREQAAYDVARERS